MDTSLLRADDASELELEPAAEKRFVPPFQTKAWALIVGGECGDAETQSAHRGI
jgi:hypothetical protein